jgi:hypothetical protein
VRRLALSAGIVAALVAAAVAVGAGSDVRVHRLHLPPPPVIDESSSDPGAPGTTVPTDPSAPPGTNPPASPPSPPGTQPPPAPPSGVGCTNTNAGTPADDTGTLEDYTLSLSATTLPVAGTLRIRGVNMGADTHAIAIKPTGAAAFKICGTPNITPGQTDTFAVTNLPAGTYVIYCTIHPTDMHENVTVG